MVTCDCGLCLKCTSGTYETFCKDLNSDLDPSVYISLLSGSESISVLSRCSSDLKLLALFKVFLETKKKLPKNVLLGTTLNYSVKGEGNWICRALTLLGSSLSEVVTLDLQYSGIDGAGLKDLVFCAKNLKELRVLNLRGNFVCVNNGIPLLVELLTHLPKPLSLLDLSRTALETSDVILLRQCAQSRNSRTYVHVECNDNIREIYSSALRSTHILIEGNFPSIEIWNSVTHGLGVLLCIAGGFDLFNLTSGAIVALRLACGVYIASGFLLFSASTLYHSFFMLTTTKYIAQVFDHCAIFVLIAGSYTPICAIVSLTRSDTIVSIPYLYILHLGFSSTEGGMADVFSWDMFSHFIITLAGMV